MLPTDNPPIKTAGIFKGVFPKYQANYGAAAGLYEFAEYVFFNPAALYLNRFEAEDIWWRFATDENLDPKIAFYKFRQPIFAGLETAGGDPAWNYVLWSVTREVWAKLDPHVQSTIVLNTADGALTGIGRQDFLVPDPLEIEKCGVFTTARNHVTVSTYGLRRADRQVGFESIAGVPTVKCFEGSSTMQAAQQAMHEHKLHEMATRLRPAIGRLDDVIPSDT